MEDDRLWEPGIHELRHPCPGHPILLTATPQRTPPEIGDMMSEYLQGATVGRHCVVIEVAADNPAQPSPCSGIGWCMRRRISCLISLSFARMRSPRVFRLIWNFPASRPLKNPIFEA
jgi:hypothetical protein